MTVAVALLAREGNVEYPTIERVPVSGRTRDWLIFIVAMSLLAVWLFRPCRLDDDFMEKNVSWSRF